MIALLIVLFSTSMMWTLHWSRRGDRVFYVTLACLAWLAFSFFVVATHSAYSFAGGGDDVSYYLLAVEARSAADAFDFARYAGRMEQPGFPVLLSLAALISGEDLLALKFVNVAIGVMLIALMGRVGGELESSAFGRRVAVAVMLLTPLWYYMAFLLKDLLIVLLQLTFLLGAVRVFRSGGRRGWWLIAVSTILVFPLRTPLVALNVGVALAVGALYAVQSTAVGHRHGLRVATVLIGTAAVATAVLIAAGDAGVARALGVTAETRLISAHSLTNFGELHFERSLMNRTAFPVLYLLSETAGFSAVLAPAEATSAHWLRGVLAIPWVYLVVPFVLIGLYVLLARAPLRVLARSPWVVVLVFTTAYLAVSWIVGDTTRWRLADMPLLAAIAVRGMFAIRPAERLIVILGTVLIVTGFASLFYLP